LEKDHLFQIEKKQEAHFKKPKNNYGNQEIEFIQKKELNFGLKKKFYLINLQIIHLLKAINPMKQIHQSEISKLGVEEFYVFDFGCKRKQI